MARDRWWEDEDEGGRPDPVWLAAQEAERQAESGSRRKPTSDNYEPPDERWTADDEADKQRREATKKAEPNPEGKNLYPQRRTTAKDGQSLMTQSSSTQMNFRIRYGDDAEWKWVEEHEQELDNLSRGLPAKSASSTPTEPVGQVGTKPATVMPTTSPAVVANARSSTVASGGQPWLAQGWSPAPTDVITITLPDGQTATMTGAMFLEQSNAGWVGDRQKYITSVRPGTDPTPRLLPSSGISTDVNRDPKTIGAPEAPSALAGGSAVPESGAVAPGSVPSATPSSTPPASSPPPSAGPVPPNLTDPVAVRNKTNKVDYWIERAQINPEHHDVIYDPTRQTLPTNNQPIERENMSNVVSFGEGRSAVRPAAPAVRTANLSAPLDSLVQMTGKPPQEAQRIAQGISALMQGDQSGAWTEPYLNDVARLAWAREQQNQGLNVDPLDAPPDYIEAWKDGFFGSDHSIPLVRELDQQMIDYAAARSTEQGRSFDWRVAFGPTGEDGLISRQIASNDCGPNAFAIALRSKGYNADPATAFEYARQKGYHNGVEFTGPYNMSRMLREEAGLNAQTIPIDWAEVDRQIDQGNVVILSSGGHYWTVSARRQGQNGTEYYGGATNAVVGNPEWATSGQFRYGGAPNAMIVFSGEIDPNSRAVRELGLKPPIGPRRELLSSQTGRRGAAVIQQQMNQNAAQNAQAATTEDEQIAFDAATEFNTDPVLVLAVLDTESGGDNAAVSPVGARGKMQIMPETARELGVTNLHDPRQNIRGGTKYLKQMLDRYDGNLDLALAAYNAGPGNVDKYGGIPPFQETQEYVRRVKAAYQRRLQRYTDTNTVR